MPEMKKIDLVNSIIKEYFIKNQTLEIVPVKDLMVDFINAGIFAKDVKKGFPIRKYLRELDEAGELNQIPLVYAERNEKNTYWYFVQSDQFKPTTPYKQAKKSIESKKEILPRSKSDSDYVIDLCDTILEKRSHRQKTFGFLLGDVHKDGKTQTRLPIKAFYEDLKIAIEYRKFQFEKPIIDEEEIEKETVSGMSRDEQQKRYDLRRSETLQENNIKLINIKYSDFSCDEKNRIVRDNDKDMKTLQNILSKYIPID